MTLHYTIYYNKPIGDHECEQTLATIYIHVYNSY